MPKFYIQSGSLQLVTTATDPRAAAIWAVHRVLSPSLPFLSDADEHGVLRPSGPLLGETIVVGEQGFTGLDRIEFETLGVVVEWTQLLAAVDRLQKSNAVLSTVC